jgi:scyllo-inositol 2-dehydrogenase (NADP+)
MLEFDQVLFTIESSRICALDRPRWFVMGTAGGYERIGVDPQEDALRAGDIGKARDLPGHGCFLSRIRDGKVEPGRPIDPVRGCWDSYYANVADHLLNGTPLAVTAEEAREVVRLLEAAEISARTQVVVAGPWGVTASL